MPTIKKPQDFQPLTDQHLEDLRAMREVLLAKVQTKDKRVGAAGIAMAAKELQRVLDRITAEERRREAAAKEVKEENPLARQAREKLKKLEDAKKSGERLA